MTDDILNATNIYSGMIRNTFYLVFKFLSGTDFILIGG